MAEYRNPLPNGSEYDECEHGVPTCHDCTECMSRAHADEIRSLNDESERLTDSIKSALCMLCEGPDAIGPREAREQAIKILYGALHHG